MPAPLRLVKERVLRCKTAHSARQIFNAMPEGHTVLVGKEVRVLRPVMMTFSPAAEATPDNPPNRFSIL